MSYIIINLMGGLGNQMSQYAFGRMISDITGIPLKFDTSYFGFKTREHEYELDKLSIDKIQFASRLDAAKHKSPIPNQLKYTRAYVLERTLAYDPLIMRKVYELQNTKKSMYFDGYWQNEHYFTRVENIIRHEFRPHCEPSQENKCLLCDITETTSIAVHIRRGNYLTNPNASSFIGALDLSYYKNAVKYIEEHVQDPHYFIFSNDPEWAKDNLKLNNPTTFVTNNANIPEEDLRLMSFCKHFIVANSSFSWWGAWLAHNQEKIVLTPTPWFLNTKADSEFEIPKGWIKINRV